MGPQSCGSPNFRNFGWQNDIWVLVSWPCIDYTIRGKVVASPKSGLWWILWTHVCLWFICAPKCSNYAQTNLLFGLCRSMWMIKVLVNHSSPILELQHTLLSPKCYKPGNTPKFRLLLLFTFEFVIESIKELGGASKSVVNFNPIHFDIRNNPRLRSKSKHWSFTKCLVLCFQVM